MPLPDWAEPPEPGFEHNNNYSNVDVVWSHPDGRVVLQQIPPALEPEPDPELTVEADDPITQSVDIIELPSADSPDAVSSTVWARGDSGSNTHTHTREVIYKTLITPQKISHRVHHLIAVGAGALGGAGVAVILHLTGKM